MPKTKFVDFKAIKAAISMEQVLSHYGLLDRFKKSGDTLSGPCPIHKGDNKTQFRVSVSKNLWHCFSECKHGGNVLDFVAKMENCSIHAAALKAVEWFNLNPEDVSAESSDDAVEETRGEPAKMATPKSSVKPRETVKPESNTPNTPLKFRLENLDTEHPYLAERGLTPEIIKEFGLGFCAKGIMAGRVVIPINNVRGELVAYAGRFPGDPDKDTPKYKLPPGFRKGQELFNLDRAIRDPEDKPLVIVEGFFDAIKLWQHGYRNVVALMGSTMSAAQAKLIFDHIQPWTSIVVMLDEDTAGRSSRDDIATRLCRFGFVRVHEFPSEGTQPEHLSQEDVIAILGGEK